MSKPLVYLAGPITGLNYAGATDWRDHAITQLNILSIKGLSPMRFKTYLSKEDVLLAEGYGDFVLSTARGIMTRDRFDCTRADLILVNFLGATRASIGTAMEIAWADLKRIPIVNVMEESGNIHDHAMINEAVGFRVPTLEEGLEVVGRILG